VLFSIMIDVTLPVVWSTSSQKVPLPASRRRLASGSFVGRGRDSTRARGGSAANSGIDIAIRSERVMMKRI